MGTGSSSGQVHIGGGVSGQNVLIGSSQTVHGDLSISVGAMPALSDDSRRALEQKVKDLIELLTAVPTDRTDDIQELHLAAADAVAEASAEHPDGGRLQSRIRALKRAAQRLTDVAPQALTLATQIASLIGAIG